MAPLDPGTRNRVNSRDGKRGPAGEGSGPFADPSPPRRRFRLATMGLALGLLLALVASGALQPVLYHVDPRDMTVFAAVIATLAVASLIASFLPAQRVTRIDPVVALATE